MGVDHIYASTYLSLSCFLQVDVIDAEYTSLVTQLRATNSFRSAYSLHRTFLATVARLAMVDNAVVQDAIERVIQVCDTNIYVCMCVLFIPILSLNLLFSILHVLIPGWLLCVVRCRFVCATWPSRRCWRRWSSSRSRGPHLAPSLLKSSMHSAETSTRRFFSYKMFLRK
jgi:hypothetical protein